MKVKLFFLLLLASVGIGCQQTSSVNANQKATVVNANKTLLDAAAETVFGTQKTGIAECDAVLAELEKQTQNANESVIDNAKRIAVKQSIYSTVRERLPETAEDKAALGKRCQQLAAPFMPAAPRK